MIQLLKTKGSQVLSEQDVFLPHAKRKNYRSHFTANIQKIKLNLLSHKRKHLHICQNTVPGKCASKSFLSNSNNTSYQLLSTGYVGAPSKKCKD